MLESLAIGKQFHMVESYRNLSTGITYYFFRSFKDEKLQKIFIQLIVFLSKSIGKKKEIRWSVNLKTISREDFEYAIRMGKIKINDKQCSYPPWLSNLEGKNVSKYSNYKKLSPSHENRIDKRLKIITPLVSYLEEISNHNNIEKEINLYAKNLKLKATVVRLWFLTYVLFGFNRYSLHYTYQNIGNWDRNENKSHVKRGRPSKIKGKGYGHNANKEMITLIINSYLRLSKKGTELTTIFSQAIVKEFGAKVITLRNGVKEYEHPLGEPIPSFWMYRYYVSQEFSRNDIQKRLKGNGLFRTKNKKHEGSYSNAVGNIMEETELDVYVCKELPQGLLEGSTLKPLDVARMVDIATSLTLGIGFSLGGESAEAYRMAQFSAAISKVKFCKLFGINIEEHQWPSKGLAPHQIYDRGPGSTEKANSSSIKGKAVIKEIAPTHSGQSKPTVETTNPKTRKNLDGPFHKKSNLKPIELVQREIIRVISANDMIDISSKIPNEFIYDVERPTPLELFRVLDSFGRNDSISISFEQAVREFLPRQKVTLGKEGIFLLNQQYSSIRLKECGILNRVGHLKAITMEAYVMNACIRNIWIDFDGELIELEIYFKLKTNDQDCYLSLSELEEKSERLKTLNTLQFEHRLAHKSEREEIFKEMTGKSWDAGKIVLGRPKRGTPIAVKENQESRKLFNAK